MIKFRIGAFETNSSGSHSLCYYDNWRDNSQFIMPTNKNKARQLYDIDDNEEFIVDFSKFSKYELKEYLELDKPSEKLAYLTAYNIYKNIDKILKEGAIEKHITEINENKEKYKEKKFKFYYLRCRTDYLGLLKLIDDNRTEDQELIFDLLNYYNDYLIEKVSMLVDEKLELKKFCSLSLDTLIYLFENFSYNNIEDENFLEIIFNKNVCLAYYFD